MVNDTSYINIGNLFLFKTIVPFKCESIIDSEWKITIRNKILILNLWRESNRYKEQLVQQYLEDYLDQDMPIEKKVEVRTEHKIIYGLLLNDDLTENTNFLFYGFYFIDNAVLEFKFFLPKRKHTNWALKILENIIILPS